MTRRLHIFYLIGTLDIGGAEGQLVQLLKGLDRDRFSATVCCLTSAAGPYADDIRQLGIDVYSIGFQGLRIFRYPHRVAGQLFRLARLIRRERPDIVHGYLFWAYVLGTFAARAARVPRVVSSRRSLGNFKAGKLHYLLLERLSNAMTSLVIANSRAVRADAMRQEKLPPRKVIVIYNGVDSSQFRATAPAALVEDLQLQDAEPVVTVVANFIDYKGHGFFFDAWRRVAATVPSAVAILVGDGPERAKWEGRIMADALGSSVRFVGSRRDIPAILALTDIVVHPSLEEGFSNAILEAMAAGRPVVATAVGGNTEAIQDGRTGILVPARDSEALAAAILILAREPGRAREMGSAGRERVARHFSVEQMVRSYESVYERLLAGTPMVATGEDSA
ncbi:MAG TPA: glycosyl transferase family 1 [Chloroflexi bacterium]|nr:glycosyl transferase family 1 [Chloroflexota bacterium]HAL27860.1 glycosyl transferase family 1 [Chloroflexota bacterium]